MTTRAQQANTQRFSQHSPSDQAESLPRLDIAHLRRLVRQELEQRRCGPSACSYAGRCGESESLYGLTGAVYTCAVLGLPLGDRAVRKEWAQRILAYRNDDGTFHGDDGPGHAVHMVLGALNLLGQSIPEDIGPLAPRQPKTLRSWLARHDWSSTHKELSSQTIPLLATGCVQTDWIEVFRGDIAERLDPSQPLATWCAPDAPAWRVISCVYHILSAFDAGLLPYPQPDLLIDRMLGLGWDAVPDSEHRTQCTDADWAWALLRLVEHRPEHAPRIFAAIRRVSARRVRAWNTAPEANLTLSTHHLYCYLWSSAVFQSAVRDHYTAGYLRDTQNAPALCRLI
ncbi:MAG: hypothetical protein ACOCWJ_05410 [Verrucomicrobiota bacterium]